MVYNIITCDKISWSAFLVEAESNWRRWNALHQLVKVCSVLWDPSSWRTTRKECICTMTKLSGMQRYEGLLKLPKVFVIYGDQHRIAISPKNKQNSSAKNYSKCGLTYIANYRVCPWVYEAKDESTIPKTKRVFQEHPSTNYAALN